MQPEPAAEQRARTEEDECDHVHEDVAELEPAAHVLDDTPDAQQVGQLEDLGDFDRLRERGS